MKYFTRLGIYKASNVMFNPSTCQAYSYVWWRFVDRIGGKVVFNSYRYSPSTAKHQSKVRRLLTELGIKIDIEIESPKGLQESSVVCQDMFSPRGIRDGMHSAVALYETRIAKLTEDMNRKGTRKAKNVERAAQIEHFRTKIKEVKRLLKLQAGAFERRRAA